MIPALLLAGCAWVTEADVTDKLQGVDDDGDGAPASTDCDDGDPGRRPGGEDPPYDGVDGDCGGEDDFDVDADGYVSDVYAGLPTEGVPGSGALPAGDCEDTLAAIHPGVKDAWYDGVDSNCDGVDDFDQDGDGYVAPEDEGAVTAYAPGTGELPAGDCDDEVAEVSPAVADDWYDGVDANCDGADDYDQDADGYVQAGDEGQATRYAPGTGSLPGGDCDDGDPARNPGAAETWYDGVDADCDEGDDYDQDGDGDEVIGHGTDCDDTNASVNPTEVEILGDALDSDCDGGADSFPMTARSGCTWLTPHDPVFLSDGATAWLSLAGVQIGCTSTYYDSAVALAFPLSDPTGAPSEVLPWQVSTVDPSAYEANEGHAAVVADGYLYGVLGLDLPRGRALNFTRYDLTRRTRSQFPVQDTEVDTPFDDVAIGLDTAGVLHAVACEDDVGTLAYVEISSIESGSPSFSGTAEGVAAATCGLDPDGVTLLTGGDLAAWTVSTANGELSLGSVPISLSATPTDLDWEGGTLAWLADSQLGATIAYDVDADSSVVYRGGATPTHVAGQQVDGTTWLAVVDADGAVRLGYGSKVLSFTTLSLPILAEDIALYVGGGYVLVAATGADEVVVGVALAP